MHSESQPDSPTGRNQSTGRWLVLVAALLCLGPTGCHSYRALPDATPAELRGPTLAQRDVEAIADEYLSALLEYAPELGTMYSLPGAPHDSLSDHSRLPRSPPPTIHGPKYSFSPPHPALPRMCLRTKSQQRSNFSINALEPAAIHWC